MALSIKQIINRNLLDGAEIVAGFQGKENVVYWVNIMEILDHPNSVQRGELLLTTGFKLEDENLHKNLILNLKNHGVSGLAIQLDYYIREIPSYIIRDANKYNFPILKIPSVLTFSSIMHTLFLEILSFECFQPNERADLLCKELKCEIKDSEFEIEDDYENYLLLIQQNENDMTRTYKEEVESAIKSIQSYFETQSDCKCVHTQNASGAVILFRIPAEKSHQNTIFELTILLTFISENQNINFYVGVDKITKADTLEKIFEHNLECIRVLKQIGAKRGVAPYYNLAFFELFSTLHKYNSSMLLGNESIQKLLDYDKSSKTSYVHTLRVYLAYESNISKTAERLFIHRHTLTKRLDRIEKICGISLQDYYTRTYLSLTMVIHDYFAL